MIRVHLLKLLEELVFEGGNAVREEGERPVGDASGGAVALEIDRFLHEGLFAYRNRIIIKVCPTRRQGDEPSISLASGSALKSLMVGKPLMPK